MKHSDSPTLISSANMDDCLRDSLDQDSQDSENELLHDLTYEAKDNSLREPNSNRSCTSLLKEEDTLVCKNTPMTDVACETNESELNLVSRIFFRARFFVFFFVTLLSLDLMSPSYFVR